MTSANIMRRLERLESADDGSGRVVVMARNDNENDAVAEARWLAAHPGESIPAAALRVVIVKLANGLPPLGVTP